MNEKCNNGDHKQKVNGAPRDMERKPSDQPYSHQDKEQYQKDEVPY